MYQGRLTSSDLKRLIKAKDTIDAWLRYQRKHPASVNLGQTYIAADASKAIESFIATLQ